MVISCLYYITEGEEQVTPDGLTKRFFSTVSYEKQVFQPICKKSLKKLLTFSRGTIECLSTSAVDVAVWFDL